MFLAAPDASAALAAPSLVVREVAKCGISLHGTLCLENPEACHMEASISGRKVM